MGPRSFNRVAAGSSEDVLAGPFACVKLNDLGPRMQSVGGLLERSALAEGSLIMPPDPSAPPAVDASGPPRGRPPDRRDGTPRRRWRRRLAIACGLIAAGLIAAFAWSELHPTALAEADAAYRRNDLEAALRLAEGHLSRRPFSRHATLLAARCLSRLDRPDQAEPYYQKAGPLDLEDRHIRAMALVLGNRREPAIRAYRDILVRRPDDVLALRGWPRY